MLLMQLLDLLDYFPIAFLVNQIEYQLYPPGQPQQLELEHQLGLQRLPAQFLD